jgi:hypothetical protein
MKVVRRFNIIAYSFIYVASSYYIMYAYSKDNYVGILISIINIMISFWAIYNSFKNIKNE